MSESPTDPEFWNTRYVAGRTPWDFRGVPPALQRFLERQPGTGQRVLIPGCGSGYEIVAFHRAGYDVTAIDFSAPAVERARSNLPSTLAERVIEGDFFAANFTKAPFDLIYERTFLCALPPDRWPSVVARTASLLAPGGLLAGIYFFGEKDDGPPFGLSPDEPAQLFDERFTLVHDEPVPAAESLSMFAAAERWQERRRKSD